MTTQNTPRVTQAEAMAFMKRASKRGGETALGDLADELTAFREAAEAAAKAREAELRTALWLFREFTIRNATQWHIGANHHHPIYPMIAELIGEMGGITSGECYRFVQADNREPLARHKAGTEGGVA